LILQQNWCPTFEWRQSAERKNLTYQQLLIASAANNFSIILSLSNSSARLASFTFGGRDLKKIGQIKIAAKHSSSVAHVLLQGQRTSESKTKQNQK